MGDLDFKFSVSAIAIILAIAVCIYVAVENGLDSKPPNNITAAVNAEYSSVSVSSESFSSDTSLSETTSQTTTTSITTSISETTTTSETTTVTTPLITTTTALTLPETFITESNVPYQPSADYTELIELYKNQLVVVGDSIASGFGVYNRLPSDRVLAQGCVAARSLHDYYYTVNGMNLDAIAATGVLQPKYVFMSMGMNDINMTTSQQYVENYTNNINEILAVAPSSEIIVMSITPIAATSSFSTNSAIDSYNAALAAMVQNMSSQGIRIHYLDAAAALKDQYNCLSYSYSGGDGIHLAPAAYDILLEKMVCFIESIGMM